jgi:hypothetical protein
VTPADFRAIRALILEEILNLQRWNQEDLPEAQRHRPQTLIAEWEERLARFDELRDSP